MIAEKACSECGDLYPNTTEYFRPTGSGAPRAICKRCDRAIDRDRWHGKNEPLALIPSNAEQFYDVERGLYSLTAIWRGAGCPRSKKPAAWFQTEQCREFLAELNIGNGYIQSDRGGAGGTWAHWQVAVEYARYLSPAFAIQWNEYAAAYIRGEQREEAIITPAPVQPDAITQVTTGLMTLLTGAIRDAVDQVFSQRMGPMPQQTADTWETLQGATVIEREVKTEVRIDLDFDGYDYVFVNDDTGQMSISETYKTPQERINNGDYNGSKDGRRPWREAFSAKIDQRKKGQNLFQKYAEGMGVRRIRGDIYEKDDQFIADICQLPRKLRLNDIQTYVERGHLFDPPMFR